VAADADDGRALDQFAFGYDSTDNSAPSSCAAGAKPIRPSVGVIANIG
jgi:hypothetical protein